MGREVRRVPKGWEHPRNSNGNYIPMFWGSYEDALQEWLEAREEWKRRPKSDCIFEEWEGRAPDPETYMWYDDVPPESELTYLQMYECTSEGTPISPAMETPEALAKWLAENEASAFAGYTATYEQWLSTIKRGFAPSAVISDGRGMRSGVEALCRDDD